MIVLGIETSCDETAAAVVKDGREVLSNVVFTQTDLHRPYGGVVPEIASRCHVEALPGTVENAVAASGCQWDQIDAVAVTYGPGLASSLLVGLAMAKGLAMRLERPLRGINHLHAHIHSAFLDEDAPRVDSVCPFVALIVSGGHTGLVRVPRPGEYVLLGQTVDDAAGEAFDKGANLLGLGYPGGPAIDRAAQDGSPAAIDFPRGRQSRRRRDDGGLRPELCFSFSGLKTALLYYLRQNPLTPESPRLADVAASYQEAIVDGLLERCEIAARETRTLVACGGVSLNRRLRARLERSAATNGFRLLLAKARYCADNAAMVAGLAGSAHGAWNEAGLALDADPSLPVAPLPCLHRTDAATDARGMGLTEPG